MSEKLNGRKLAKIVTANIAEKTRNFQEYFGRKPQLALVVVGNNKASEVYVGNKEKACERVGIISTINHLPDSTTEIELLTLIKSLNHDEKVDGILVQLPLPKHINSDHIIEAIDILKDVDGFHPHNIGQLWTGKYSIAPCTPSGIIQLLAYYDIDVKSMNCVIVGRSNIVGKPMAALLLERNATVTLAHSKTRNLAALCKSADLLVAAIGKPAFITEEFLRDHAILIDVGINHVNRNDAPSEWLANGSPLRKSFVEKGYRLIGDIDPFAAMRKSSYYTPVPGGVGKMTVAVLLHNTITLATKRQQSLS